MKKVNKIKSGFQTPPHYFQNFNQNLKDKMKEQASHANQSGFKVPETYFEEFNATIKSKIAEETKFDATAQPKVIRLTYWLSSAAAILVVVGSLWFFGLNQSTNTTNSVEGMVLDNLDQQLINLYVEDYILPYEDLSIDLYTEFQINDIAELDLINVEQQKILNYFEDDMYDADFLNE